MKIAVLRFPGSNCDDDALWASRLLGHEAAFVWHKETTLPSGIDAVIIPGGFSYGDYLRAGALAALSPIIGAARTFADAGGPVLAICNGFQIACEAGLLDGALTRNASLRFSCRDVHLRCEGKATPFTRAIPAGRVLRLPIAHAEGRYLHPEPKRLFDEGRVIFRYSDAAGGISDEANPNGSVENIAGITNARGNVLGLMPHPERACEALTGGIDGRQLFDSLLDSSSASNRGQAK